MLLTANTSGIFHYLAFRGEILLIELLIVLFFCAAMIAAPTIARRYVLYRLAGTYAIMLVAFYIIAAGSIFSLLTAFLIGPHIIFILKDMSFMGAVLVLPSALVTFALSMFAHPTTPIDKAALKKSLVRACIRGIIISALIVTVIISGATAYVRSLPPLSYSEYNLGDALETGTYPEEQMRAIAESNEFIAFFDTTFPYKFLGSGIDTTFTSSDDFQTRQPGIWEETRRNAIYRFFGQLKFCRENPILGFIPSCVSQADSGQLYSVDF